MSNKRREQWAQHDIDRANTPDTSPLDWDEASPSGPSSSLSEEDFMQDEYCWMHSPGGWSCPVCVQARRHARHVSQ